MVIDKKERNYRKQIAHTIRREHFIGLNITPWHWNLN